jgi:SAM-dependent methyltransferase
MRRRAGAIVRGVRRAVGGGRARELRQRVDALSPSGPTDWYYHLDFGHGVVVRPELRHDEHAGEANWSFIEQHLPPLEGLRVLDIGCNAGLYALRMVDAGAAEVVGVDLAVEQAEFVRDHFAEREGRDYRPARFVAADVRTYDLTSLGSFDLATLFCVAYHLGEAADRVIAQVARMAPTVVLQGNLPRVTGVKYADRPFQELAGVEGMSELLRRNGLDAISVVAPEGHPKPLVIGRAADVTAQAP